MIINKIIEIIIEIIKNNMKNTILTLAKKLASGFSEFLYFKLTNQIQGIKNPK